MSDDEPVDPKQELVEKIGHAHCSKDWKSYEGCTQRLKNLPADSGKNCSGIYNEYWKCVDHAIANDLFKRLK